MKVLGVALALLLAVSCSSASRGGPPIPIQTTTSPDTIRSVASAFATLDHSRHALVYRELLAQLHGRCRSNRPPELQQLVAGAYQSVTSHHLAGATYLSVLRGLGAGVAPNGPRASCLAVRRAFTSELGPIGRTGRAFGGYAATTSAFAAAHQAISGTPDGYGPRLGNGRPSFVAEGDGRVTTLIRNFDPPVSQALAISSIEHQLLPAGGLHSVYTLADASDCYEDVLLSPALARLLSSSTLGVMIELTSGQGISSHYQAALVDRARLSTGGRIGGEPCV